MPYIDNGETIRLVPPRDLHDPERAIQAWLLAFWHLLPKRRHRFFRNRPSLSLELVSDGESSWLQAWSNVLRLADITRAVLGGATPGVEVESIAASDIEQLFFGDGVSADLRMKWSGDIPLGDVLVDPQPGILRSLSEGPALIQLLLDVASIRTKEGNVPGFWFSGRIVCTGTSTRRRLAGISGALGQLAGVNRLLVGKPCKLSDGQRERIVGRRSLRRVLPSGVPATPAQIASLFHFPTQPGATPGFTAASSVRTPVPHGVREGIFLGSGLDRRGAPARFLLPPENLVRHALVVGPSGSGKTLLFAQIARELIAQGQGLTVIDPHGGLVTEIASTLPNGAEERAAIVRFSDPEHVVGLNPLAAAQDRETFVADELVELVGRVYGRGNWGPLLDLALRHSAIASAEIGGSILDSAELLEDPYYREDVALRVRNPATVRYLDRLGDASGLDRRVLPALHRLDRMLSSPTLRSSLALPKQTLSLGRVFAERRVLLLDLSGIGLANARVLGSILLLLIRNATLSRPFEAPLHTVLVDEASLFVSPTIAEMLDQARKYRVGVALAVQRLSQLEPESLRSAVTANVANLLSFRVLDRDDAVSLAKLFADSRLNADDLQGLGRFEAYGRVAMNGAVERPGWFRSAEPQPSRQDAARTIERLITNGRDLYTRPRRTVEAELSRRRSPQLDDPEIITVEEPYLADPA